MQVAFSVSIIAVLDSGPYFYVDLVNIYIYTDG